MRGSDSMNHPARPRPASNDKPQHDFGLIPPSQWKEVLGTSLLGMDSDEIDQLTRALFRHSPRCIRLRGSVSIESLPFNGKPVPWYSQGMWLTETNTRPAALLNYAAGDYYIQDASSMLALSMCGVEPGQQVCDVCAAPGGKSTGIVDQLRGKGFLLSNEVISNRIELLKLALCRSGWGNFCLTQLDADSLADALGSSFDRVLVDAPCTGQSMVGSSRQSLGAFSPSQISHCAKRQKRILSAASRLTRPGGRLVYSTCTFSIAENEEIIQDFLDQHPQWRLIQFPNLEKWSSPILAGCYRLWPHRDRCDGSFAAALEMDDDVHPVGTRSRSRAGHRKYRWLPWKEPMSKLDFFADDPFSLFGYGPRICNGSLDLFERSIPEAVIELTLSGLPMAYQKNGRWQPCYGSSVLREPSIAVSHSIDLDDFEAARYVAGESLQLNRQLLDSGWCRVQWNHRALSWGKLVGGTLKNHFPKPFRQPNLFSGGTS